jgi:hypothetical protein
MNNTPTPETDDLAIICYIDSVIEGVFGFRAVPIDDCRKLERERDEAREQNAKLREALLRVRTWGLASKNWSATHGDDMAQWIDAGCVGELPPPRSEWICGKLEGAK